MLPAEGVDKILAGLEKELHDNAGTQQTKDLGPFWRKSSFVGGLPFTFWCGLQEAGVSEPSTNYRLQGVLRAWDPSQHDPSGLWVKGQAEGQKEEAEGKLALMGKVLPWPHLLLRSPSQFRP